jgi:hypothetical protein
MSTVAAHGHSAPLDKGALALLAIDEIQSGAGVCGIGEGSIQEEAAHSLGTEEVPTMLREDMVHHDGVEDPQDGVEDPQEDQVVDLLPFERIVLV